MPKLGPGQTRISQVERNCLGFNCCGGLKKNGPHGLICLNVLSPGSEIL